jgi:hypothetical protein
MDEPGDGSDDSIVVSTAVDPDEDVAMGVLRAVAAIEDEPIESLPQLYHTLDPDALSELVEDEDFEGTIEFAYHSYWVRVDSDREIEIHDDSEFA